MSNFARVQEENKERRAWERTTKEILSKFFFDISKLIFAAIVLGSFAPMFTNGEFKFYWSAVIIGLITSVAFALIGYNFLKDK